MENISQNLNPCFVDPFVLPSNVMTYGKKKLASVIHFRNNFSFRKLLIDSKCYFLCEE